MRYFWYKLDCDFFKDKRRKKMRKQAGGDTMVIVYLEMVLLSVKNEGEIPFEGTEKDIIEQISLEIDEEPLIIEQTIAWLQHEKIIGMNDSGMVLPEAMENFGSECASAKRVKSYRERKKKEALQCNASVTLSVTERREEKIREDKIREDAREDEKYFCDECRKYFSFEELDGRPSVDLKETTYHCPQCGKQLTEIGG